MASFVKTISWLPSFHLSLSTLSGGNGYRCVLRAADYLQDKFGANLGNVGFALKKPPPRAAAVAFAQSAPVLQSPWCVGAELGEERNVGNSLEVMNALIKECPNARSRGLNALIRE